jgi:SH3 domain-containing YSC84-like protein 1
MILEGTTHMKRFNNIALAATFLTAASAFANTQDDVAKRLDNARSVITEMMKADDKGVPQDLLMNAHCVIVIPNLKKAGFIVGGQYGKGYASCREKNRTWTAPAAVRIEGGSFGLQIGAAETDLILLVMNDNGMKHLLESKFQIGGEATAAAGPVGRDVSARTDAMMKAEMLTYSRARGIFAGISLQGSTLRQDLDDNTALYGKSLENKEILSGSVPVPAGAKEFRATLGKFAN